MEVTLNLDLSIFFKMVLADLHDIACSYESPPNKINIFFYSPLINYIVKLC